MTDSHDFATCAAAKQAGFRELRPWEYGGTQITVKGKRLARNPETAKSESAWSREAFRVREGEQPHAVVRRQVAGRETKTYPVYRRDQVEPKRRFTPKAPVAIDVLAAVWTVNRRTKRLREAAKKHYRRRNHGFAGRSKDEKLELYRLKGQALHYLLAEQRLTVTAYHRFPDGNWAEVLTGEGYTFHRPCADPGREPDNDIDTIEARPRGRREPRLKDAVHTLREYLSDKPRVPVYQWQPRERARRRGAPEMHDEWDDAMSLD